MKTFSGVFKGDDGWRKSHPPQRRVFSACKARSVFSLVFVAITVQAIFLWDRLADASAEFVTSMLCIF